METKRVLISDKLSEQGIQALRARSPSIEVDVKTGLKKEALLEIIGGYDGLIVRSATKVDRDVIEAAKRLRVVGRAGIGVDNIDLDAATKRGIIVMNTPQGNVITTAEHAIALMFSLARHIPQATASMRAGKWEKSKFEGRELYQKTLGIIGLGNIGKIVASRALGLKMKVIAFDPFVTTDRAKELGVELVSLDGLLSGSHFITLHVPCVEGTRGIINKAAIEKMRPGTFLINAARGGLVDEAAVADAVKSGKLAGAAFDVFDSEPPKPDNPLLGVDNIILTPHLGASTHEAQENVAVDVAAQIGAFLDTGEIRNALNAPSVSSELMSTIAPWMEVGRCVGLLAGQLYAGGLKQVRLRFEGKVSEYPVDPIAVAMLTGLLSARLDGVNEVNAPFIAKEGGIETVQERSSTSREFTSQVQIRVEGDQGTTEVGGTLVGPNEVRITEVNDVRLEIVPKGHVLFTEHFDRPGMIGKIGSILGNKELNISRLVLAALPGEGNRARAAISIDGPPSQEVLDQVRKVDGIQQVLSVRFV